MVKHPVCLRGYGAAVNDFSAAPLLVKRVDQEFVPALLEGLRRGASPTALGRPDVADDSDGSLRLFQPFHRTFNLVVLEAVCEQPGSPRLDPRDIESAGFVVRRVQNSKRLDMDEAWGYRADHIVGWRTPADWRLDPDPQHRRPLLNAGNPHINGMLAKLYASLEPAAERTSPLFVAPPDVCIAAARTLLYGVIPVTSTEHSEEVETVSIDPSVVQATMPGFLRPLGRDVLPTLGFSDFSAVSQALATDPTDSLSKFMQDLRLIQFGWRPFDSPEGAPVLSLLNRISLRFGQGHRPLGDYLGALSQRFILRTDTSTDPIPLPDEWPEPDAALANQIREAVRQSLQARLQESEPNRKRFDEDENALYRIHAFMRVRRPDGCPPELQWSQQASATFKIAPWWESGGGPIHTISLPDLDSESIKKIKPNIAFSLPPKLAALLSQNKPEDFLAGKAQMPSAGGVGIGWICSFSIPVITLCAFIVLNIFLMLLNIVFQWLFYIKICLPFPKPK